MFLSDTHYSKDLSVLLESDTGKKIYGKFMNIADETAQTWLQGIVDLAEILHYRCTRVGCAVESGSGIRCTNRKENV